MSDRPPPGCYFAFEDVDELPFGPCWFIKVYENCLAALREVPT